MADFDIQDPNVFSEKLRKFETTDKAHADLFNAVVEVLINNDAFLKAVADDYSKRHKTDETIHISAKEREDWNEKAEKSTATQTENGLLSAEDKEKLDGIAAGANKYTHPATDGNKHVPATGTTNDGKILMAGSTSGNFAWKHPTFTQAASRANLTPGEKLMISLGKIMKWFADLKAHAFAFPVNNLLGTDANLALSAPMGKELDRKIAELNNELTEQNKLLWYGDAISSGILACDTTGYTVFDVYCTDGVMLRGVKGYDTTNKRYFAMLGASGAANNRSQWVPAIWKGLIDIYDDHFYLHDITLYTIQDGGSYPQKQITSIYGVW